MLGDVQFIVLKIFAIKMTLRTNVDSINFDVIQDFMYDQSGPKGILMVTFIALIHSVSYVAI